MLRVPDRINSPVGLILPQAGPTGLRVGSPSADCDLLILVRGLPRDSSKKKTRQPFDTLPS